MSEDGLVVESIVQRPEADDLPVAASTEHTNDDGPENSRKRTRTDTGDEEKRRGKRLFGSLLGTLGGFRKDANSVKSKERASRQAELEQRQKERLQKAADEIAMKQAEDAAARRQKERDQDLEFDRLRSEAVYAQKVLLAHHLSTTTANSSLCYMPWKLTPEQEARIDEQIRIAKKEQAAALKLFTSTADSIEEGQPSSDVMITDQPRGDDLATTGTAHVREDNAREPYNSSIDNTVPMDFVPEAERQDNHEAEKSASSASTPKDDVTSTKNESAADQHLAKALHGDELQSSSHMVDESNSAEAEDKTNENVVGDSDAMTLSDKDSSAKRSDENDIPKSEDHDTLVNASNQRASGKEAYQEKDIAEVNEPTIPGGVDESLDSTTLN